MSAPEPVPTTVPAPPVQAGPAQADPALFEVAWEICHPIGGVHTVIRSRTAGRVARLGPDFICVGPWLLAEPPQGFVDDPTEADFAEGCRAAGLPVRVGHWAVPGRPRTILVEFSGLIPEKDRLLGALWDKHKVDSLGAGWDYLEPVLFGTAAGRVIERWCAERIAARRRRAVVHAHEWSAAAALLHLTEALPGMGTVFQAHSMVLGSAARPRGPGALARARGPDVGAGRRGPRRTRPALARGGGRAGRRRVHHRERARGRRGRAGARPTPRAPASQRPGCRLLRDGWRRPLA